ncbi:MAG: hypothetical protein OEZ36_11660 [Spirochaetota bacterium]|nr:hypothetical protein [Spirochaetota bacterium]
MRKNVKSMALAYIKVHISENLDPELDHKKNETGITGDTAISINHLPEYVFHTRYPWAEDICRTVIPALKKILRITALPATWFNWIVSYLANPCFLEIL